MRGIHDIVSRIPSRLKRALRIRRVKPMSARSNVSLVSKPGAHDGNLKPMAVSGIMG